MSQCIIQVEYFFRKSRGYILFVIPTTNNKVIYSYKWFVVLFTGVPVKKAKSLKPFKKLGMGGWGGG